MKVNVKYFASPRERMGAAGAVVEAPENASAGGALAAARGVEFDSVMMAVNLEYVRPGHPSRPMTRRLFPLRSRGAEARVKPGPSVSHGFGFSHFSKRRGDRETGRLAACRLSEVER